MQVLRDGDGDVFVLQEKKNVLLGNEGVFSFLGFALVPRNASSSGASTTQQSIEPKQQEVANGIYMYLGDRSINYYIYTYKHKTLHINILIIGFVILFLFVGWMLVIANAMQFYSSILSGAIGNSGGSCLL